MFGVIFDNISIISDDPEDWLAPGSHQTYQTSLDHYDHLDLLLSAKWKDSNYYIPVQRQMVSKQKSVGRTVVADFYEVL